jgi:asparagine synthase (glutamine-hydrolysing)
MATFVALAGWPAAEPPPGAWTTRLGDDVPVALAALPGSGPAVAAATSADGRLHVVLAGALANRRELEHTAGRRGGAAAAHTDPALVLRLYEARGEQSVSALRGGFAIAIWDGRRGRMVLARDQLGVQTLYVAAARAHCVASPRLAPLLRVPGLAGSADVACVDVLLALGTVPAPATAYPGIRHVCPGELLVWEPGRLRAQRYWQLRFPEVRDARRAVVGDLVRRTREQLDESVRVRVAGRLTGMLLSGGIGAGSVLAVAAGLDRRPVASVTIASDFDDATQAAAVARRAGVDHAALVPDVDWVAAADATLAAHGEPIGAMDEPLLAPAAAALAGRTELLLLGCGADDVLGGGPAERAWAGSERYRRLPSLARECVDILAATGWLRGLAPSVRAARSAPVDVLADTDVALDVEARHALLGADLLRMVDGATPTRAALGALVGEAASQGATDARDVLYAVRLAVGVPRTAARLAAALPGDVETSFPLADPRMAQASAALAPALRASFARRADLLRQAIAPDLPREARWRSHQALVAPPDAWRRGSLRTLVEETLAPDRVAHLGILDPNGVARLRAAHATGRTELAAMLWRLTLVSRWLERPQRSLADDSPAAAPRAARA